MNKTVWKLMQILALLSCASFWASCASRDSFKGGRNEKKPAIMDEQKLIFSETNAKRFHGKYQFHVRRADDDKIVCDGEADIINYPHGTLTTGSAPCDDFLLNAAGVDDITFEGDPNATSESMTNEEIQAAGLDPRITRTLRSGDTTYSPHKPGIIGPIIQDWTKYGDIDETQAVKVRHETDDPDEPVQEGEGFVRVKMLQAGIEFQPEGYPEKFKDVIHYSVNATGFEGLDIPVDADLYDVFEIYYSTHPIMILKVHIEGNVQDFEGGGITGAAGNLIFGGGIVIDLTLREIVK